MDELKMDKNLVGLKIKALQAFHGDSILVSFSEDGKTRNILIDGGPGITYSKRPKALKTEIEQILKRRENIDLLVVTHIDDDHIGGIIKLFEYGEIDPKIIKEVWFNSGELISSFFDTDTGIGTARESKIRPKSGKILNFYSAQIN